MNCFQKFVSLIFWATGYADSNDTLRLWIAFKSLYLWYSEQLYLFYPLSKTRCELLSKVCIFDILSNNKCFGSYFTLVVNCFQKFVSLIFWATRLIYHLLHTWLWIAFKSLYLWYSEQPLEFGKIKASRCELLSKVCIFDILSNQQPH